MELEDTTCIIINKKNKAAGMVTLNKKLMPRTISKIKSIMVKSLLGKIPSDIDMALAAAVIEDEIWKFLTNKKYEEIRESRSVDAAIYQITSECVSRIKTEVPVNKRINELKSLICNVEDYTEIPIFCN
jgi:UTP-glucose-1-phosphate uridylyltransferase